MSLRNKMIDVIEDGREGAAKQWHDFINLGWKWAFGYLAFIPFFIALHYLGQMISH